MSRGERYIATKPCKHCEGLERYVSNRKCCQCNTMFYKIEIEAICDQCKCTYNKPQSRIRQRFCSSQCKELWRNDNTDYQAVKEKKYAERFSRRDFIRNYKMEKGCESCGYKEHPSALQLDHLDPSDKKYTLSQCISLSWKTLEEELKKCRVLCANCHAVHTYNQYHEGIFKKEKGNANVEAQLCSRKEDCDS